MADTKPAVDNALHPAVFLDRDGVINRALVREGKPYPPPTLDQVEILPGVPKSLERLKKAGFFLVVVTNQPDVARGTQSIEVVESIHKFLKERLPIDRFETCCHDNGDGCSCRKPEPGLLLQAAESMKIDLTRSYMVGDRWRDIEAGLKAGCETFFIDYGYQESLRSRPDHIVLSLADAVDWILK